jgi:2-methylcitrate dehydratase PrpD
VGRSAPVLAVAPGQRVGPLGFIRDLTWADVPEEVRDQVGWLMLDATVAAEEGRRLAASEIVCDYVSSVLGGTAATCLFDGRRVSAPGAALANGTLLNAVDFDDGHPLAKGHPGAVVIPAALAIAEQTGATVAEFALAALIGYEIAIRAALMLHARTTVVHSSGAWGAMGATAAAARLLGLDEAQTGHALGLAEYHAPMDLVMRAVAEPSMAKDAIGWAAHVGVSSALLAQRGFTAHASEFAVTAGTADAVDLGQEWQVLGIYVKPYPCCRWAHPAIDAVRQLAKRHGADALRTARHVEVRTFGAAASLSTAVPETSEQAQFNLRWPVACALVTGRFDIDSVTTDLVDPAIRAMHDRITVKVDQVMTERFPANRSSEVLVQTAEGQALVARVDRARGDPSDPGWQAVIRDKVSVATGHGDLTRLAAPPTLRLGELGSVNAVIALRYPLINRLHEGAE